MSSPGFHSIPQFGAIFDAALNDYAQKTGTDLRLTTHPLAAALESCHSPEAILDVLREQAHAFNQYRNGDWKIRLMRHLKPTVVLLLGLSTSGVLGDHGIGLFPPAKAIFAAVGHLLATAKGVSTSYDALVELFEVFEHYLGRLKIFTEIPSAVGEVLVKIMAELLTNQAGAIQEIREEALRGE
ncbi:hypothetical protein BC827DRAFT_1385567 [Russula dissimulans]|nr:hypothetical protein BC827DRAFT_1385567 [Russula dissimulans]